MDQGLPLRIVWVIREDFIHTMDAGFTTIWGDELFAQIDGIVRQIPRGENQTIDLDAVEQSHWHGLFGTTGEVRNFQSKAGELKSWRDTLRWYTPRVGASLCKQ